MEELQKLIMSMKTDLDERFTLIDSQLQKSEQNVTTKLKTHINEKFENLNEDLTQLRSKLEIQEKRLNQLERNGVQRNIIIFGVEEQEKSYFDLQEIVTNIIKTSVGIDIQENELVVLRRLGKKGSRARPISVELSTLGKKIKILKSKNKLQNTEIYIKEEFPNKVLQIRKELEAEKQKEIEKGNIAYIKYDKLVVKETQKRKRQPTESPPQLLRVLAASTAPVPVEVIKINEDRTKPVPKKNKSLNIRNYLHSS